MNWVSKCVRVGVQCRLWMGKRRFDRVEPPSPSHSIPSTIRSLGSQCTVNAGGIQVPSLGAGGTIFGVHLGMDSLLGYRKSVLYLSICWECSRDDIGVLSMISSRPNCDDSTNPARFKRRYYIGQYFESFTPRLGVIGRDHELTVP